MQNKTESFIQGLITVVLDIVTQIIGLSRLPQTVTYFQVNKAISDPSSLKD
jgi:hypothetical protein